MSAPFHFMDLPRELRNKVYKLLVVKPGLFIGEVGVNGIRCEEGVACLGDVCCDKCHTNNLHFTPECRHPAHEATQIIRDFKKFRCLNLSLTSRTVHDEVSTEFFSRNGFQFHHGNSLDYFLDHIPKQIRPTLRNVRFVETFLLPEETARYYFSPDKLPCFRTFADYLETEVFDFKPNLTIAHALETAITGANFDITNLSFVYHVDVPSQIFRPAASQCADSGFWTVENVQAWHGENVRFVLPFNLVGESALADIPILAKHKRLQREVPYRNDFGNLIAQDWDRVGVFNRYAYLMTRLCEFHYTVTVGQIMRPT